jgi:hypothetical protein
MLRKTPQGGEDAARDARQWSAVAGGGEMLVL